MTYTQAEYTPSTFRVRPGFQLLYSLASAEVATMNTLIWPDGKFCWFTACDCSGAFFILEHAFIILAIFTHVSNKFRCYYAQASQSLRGIPLQKLCSNKHSSCLFAFNISSQCRKDRLLNANSPHHLHQQPIHLKRSPP